jgi:hypothetical protein
MVYRDLSQVLSQFAQAGQGWASGVAISIYSGAVGDEVWLVAGLGDSKLSYTRLILERHRALVCDRRVPSPRIVEAFHEVDTSAFASSRDRSVRRAIRSVLSDETKLSIAALSQTLSGLFQMRSLEA